MLRWLWGCFASVPVCALQRCAEAGGLILTGAVQRLMLLPLAAWGVTAACGLPPAAAGVVIIFAALPTAQSCYVMTAAMHGNAPAVAAATALQTLAAIVTLPIWISLAIL